MRSKTAIRLFLCLLCCCGVSSAQHGRKTQNIIYVMTDGLRWQEVFSGADERLMNMEHGKVKDVPALKQMYWRDTPEERRMALMPFLWTVVAKQGRSTAT